MDSRNHFIEKFTAFIGMVDDEYLIGLTNKGIFNRAVKDMGSGDGIQYEIEADAVKCTLADGNVCRITEDVKAFKCTCPSKTMCKHAVMSYLYMKKNIGVLLGDSQGAEAGEKTEGEAPVEAKMQDYSPLLAIEEAQLRKLLGERAYEDILNRLKFGVVTEIEEKSLLTIRFKDEDVTVKFPPVDPMAGSICSCKSSEFCKHRAEAVLHYKVYKKTAKIEDILSGFGQNDIKERKQYEDVLKDVKKLIEEILLLGLSRVPDTMKERLEQMAVLCHSANLANLEKYLRDAAGELALYLGKNAAFSRSGFRYKVERIYTAASVIENCTEAETFKMLAGVHKSSYHEIPPVLLYAMGASAWQSKSGYEGITCYFYHEGLKKWMTYTESRPTFYDGVGVNTDAMYKGSAPWNLSCRWEAFCKSRIKLICGKANADRRLSAGEQSRGEILGRTAVDDLDLAGILFADWKLVLDKIGVQMMAESFKREENGNLLILKPHHWGKSSFDKVNQRFDWPVYDEADRAIYISIAYTPKNKKLIESLERMEKRGSCPDMVLGFVNIYEDRLSLFPVAGYRDGKIVNWTLE